MIAMPSAPTKAVTTQSPISAPPTPRVSSERTSVTELLAHLQTLDIQLWLTEDRLHYSAPNGAMTPALATQLREQKAAIIAFLARANASQALTQATIPLAPRHEQLPLSFAQERLWLLDQLEAQRTAYNMPAALHLQGALDGAALTASLNELIRRHESLRTTFPAVDGTPIQRINAPTPIDFPVIDLCALPAPARDAEVKRLSAQEATLPFDLASGPLLRVTLLKLTTIDHVLLLTMHHMIADGWSIKVMIGELGALYGAFSQHRSSPLPELPIQYADFAHWQRQWLQGERLASELAFWQTQLAGAPPLLELPTYQPRPPIQRFRGARLRFTLDATLTRQLRELSQQQGATLAMTLLSAFKILLARYSGQHDIVVGLPIANRNHAGIEELIGFFLNTLLLRTDLADNPSFSALLARVRQATIEAYTHQDLPFIKLAEALHPDRMLSYNPLFQVLFLYQGESSQVIPIPGLQVTMLDNELVQLNDDLVLELEEQGATLHGTWAYNLDLFQAAFIERFSAHFEALLRAIVRDPSQGVLQMPMLNALERHQLLMDWNNTDAYLDANLSFLRCFDAQVQQTPNAIAVSYRDQRLSYAELQSRASQMAQHVRAQVVGPETVVAVLAQRSPDFLTTILAVFKAGGAYLPLDLRSPAARLGQVLEQSAAPLVLAAGEFRPLLTAALATIPVERRPQVLWIEQLPGETTALFTEWPHAQGTDLAYVLYTSGSTGVPKGAMVEQRGMLNHLFAKIKDLNITHRDIVAQNASQSFVVSVWQFLAALVVGGTVHIVPDDIAGDPQQLLQTCIQQEVTILEMVPSLLRTLLDEIVASGTPALPKLRWLVPTGEMLPPSLARQWLLHYPTIPLLNAYGSTECSDDVAHCRIDTVPAETVLKMPIGRPVLNTRLYVLDAQRQPVPIGVAGELYVGGIPVGRGYRHDPERTAQAFVVDALSNDPVARLYKTGDKARYRPDGNIEYLGRMDFQVKLRGFRIELGEIEAILAQHPAVAQTVVVAIDDGHNHEHQQLVAYVVSHPNTTVDAETLRQFVSERLPNYMVPAACLLLPALPLNNSGKVDRKALPRPVFADNGSRYVAPRTANEAKLAEIWQSLLASQQVGVESNFFDLGGHSLLATQVVSRIRQQFGVELPLRTLFETPTIRAIAHVLEKSQPAHDRPAIVPLPRTGPLPLSFAQQRFWFIDQLAGSSAGYAISGALRLRGKLDQPALQASLQAVVQRHESLRTTFVTVDGQPVQHIAETVSVALPIVDLQDLPGDQRLAACQTLAFAEAQQLFALATGPLLRCTGYQLADDDFVLLVVMHHIIADGWSIGVMSHEVIEHYRQQVTGHTPSLPALTIQVADYAEWQRTWLQGQRLQTQLAYWKTQLAGAPALLELPTDRPRTSTPTFRSDSLAFALSPSLTQQLNQVAQQHGVTLYMTLLAAFATLLGRHSGQDEVVIGSPIANRTSQELEALIGCFVNTLALRIDLQHNPSFSELLRQVRQTTLDAYAHQDIPFEQIVDALDLPRTMNQTPLCQVLLAWQGTSQPAFWQNGAGNIAGLDVAVLPWKKPTVEFDLVLSLAEEPDGIQGSWEFSCDLFDRSTIERMARHFHTLLEAIAATPNRTLAQLPILGDDELATLALRGKTTALGQLPQTLHYCFEQQAAQTPQAVAVICGAQRLTYAALNRRANQLAHHLRAQGIGRGSCVGICMDRAPEMVVAVLGAIKAGATYLPLDPAYPPERLQFMLEDAAVALLLTQSHLLADHSSIAPLLHSQGTTPILALDTAWSRLLEEPTGNLPAIIAPTDPLYMIYTSGTTGNPKGVIVPHQGVVNTVAAISEALGLREGDRFLQFAPFGFDVSAMQLFTTLTSGATVVLDPTASQLSLNDLMHLCDEQAITVLDLPVALWQQSVHEMKALGHTYPRSLRSFLTGGEKPAAETLLAWAALAEQRMTFLCSYGPTEASITTTIFVTDSERIRQQPPAHIPLGEPLPNTSLYILDANQVLVPLGVAGELCIGGIGLALGYHNQPQLTAQKFIEHPVLHRLYRTGDLVRRGPDGSVEFLGRVDSQVKVRGFRIELGEIEACLKAHPQVREAVVTVIERAAHDKRIVAYYQPEDEAPTLAALRDFLKTKLPAHMLPSAYVTSTSWPLTPNGKLDRKALPLPDFSLEGEFVAPRNATERRVANIWGDVLGLETIGVESNFFDVGGHSLLAIQIVARIRQHFGIDIPLRSLLEEPTVAGIACHLDQIEQTLSLLRPTAELADAPAKTDPETELTIANNVIASNVEVFEL